MPELPEIESLARQLGQHVVGDVITAAWTRQPKSMNVPAEELAETLRWPQRTRWYAWI
jgi:formamidopyrimidine-DNA glycosylase